MATALQILSNTFGVKAISPTDPGIIKLAAIRTGVYPELSPNPITVTPTQEALQLLGRAPDPLAAAARAGTLDQSSSFLDKTLPNVLLGVTAAVAGVGFASEVPSLLTSKLGGTTSWASGMTSSAAFQDFLVRLARARLTPVLTSLVSSTRQTYLGAFPPMVARLLAMRRQ